MRRATSACWGAPPSRASASASCASGAPPISRAAALTHTGAITGDWDLWARLARRQGAAVLETLDELHEFGALAQSPHRPRSSRIWAVTNSGGQGSQIADVLAAFRHVELPQPDAAHLADFAEAFPRAGQPGNPQDLGGCAVARGVPGRLPPDRRARRRRHAAHRVRRGARPGRLRGRDDGRARAHGARGRHGRRALPRRPPRAARRRGAPAPAGGARRRRDALGAGAAGLRALAALLGPAGPPLDAEELAAMADRPTAAPRLDHAAALALLARRGVAVPRTVVAATRTRRRPRPRLPRAARREGRRAGAPRRRRRGRPRPAPRRRRRGRAADGEIPGCRGFELAEQVPADLELLVHVALDAQLGPRATLGVGGALSEQAGLAVCDLAPRTVEEPAGCSGARRRRGLDAGARRLVGRASAPCSSRSATRSATATPSRSS